MFDPEPSFRPVRWRDGYLPLEDLGLVGAGATVALVGLAGSIPWLCLPRFDGGGSLGASLLALPLRGVVPADHPRMVATTTAVAERLSAGNDAIDEILNGAAKGRLVLAP
jgi:hypothetical protein